MDRYKRKVGKFILIPTDGGKFEVSVGDELAWSKVATGAYPEVADITKVIDRKLKG